MTACAAARSRKYQLPTLAKRSIWATRNCRRARVDSHERSRGGSTTIGISNRNGINAVDSVGVSGGQGQVGGSSAGYRVVIGRFPHIAGTARNTK